MSDYILRADNIYHATVGESYSWNGDTFEIASYVVQQVDDARAKEITNHFKCDMSDFRKWLEEKKKPIRTNADRIRTLTDEELAAFLDDISNGCDNCPKRRYCLFDAEEDNCRDAFLKWLKQEAEE